MYNYVMLVGRIASSIDIKEYQEGKKYLSISLAVNKPFKNADGVYDTDFIRVSIWNQSAELTNEYCKTGMLIGVKGRLQTSKVTLQSGAIIDSIEVIGEKIMFLSPKDYIKE